MVRKDMEGSDHGTSYILSWHLLGGTEGNHKKLYYR
jgi:hypothetical protein